MKKVLLALVRAYVSDCYEMYAPDVLVYHNLAHTEDVVNHCRELAKYYCLNEKDETRLLAAAWFHDIGQIYTTPEKHEEESIEIMRSFLNENSTTEDISIIGQLILATRMTAQPITMQEKIIRDADTYHFGTKKFFTTDALVKREMEWRTGHSFPDWNKRSLELLKSHRFYTSYCRKNLQAGKKENIAILEAKR